MMRVIRAVLDWLFPKKAICMGCGSIAGCQEDWICPACRQQLAKRWVGAAMPPLGLDGAAFAYVYADSAASIVQRLKYSGIGQLAGFMGEDMATAYHFIEPTGADCVVCAPMNDKRRRKRGFNHAELLARDVANRLGLKFIDALRCTRVVRQQARLNAEQRLRNLDGVIALKAPVKGRRVILVDDVSTTGATARACAKALREGGAAGVYLLCYTVARGKKDIDAPENRPTEGMWKNGQADQREEPHHQES